MHSPNNKESQRRVAFIAHALARGYLSSKLIDERLKKLGKLPLDENDGKEAMCWWDTEYGPVDVPGAYSVHMDFDIIPQYARDMMRQIGTDDGYQLAATVAEHEMAGALNGGSPVWIGWGALTKNLTEHGDRFLRRHPPLDSQLVSTNHGDAGTTALTLMALERLGVKPRKCVVILGASGVIGSALARAVGGIVQAQKVVLVGRKLEELQKLSREIASPTLEVVVCTDYTTAAVEHHADVVLVATNGNVCLPEHFPDGCLVLDVTTPSACDPKESWSKRVVLSAGCGRIPQQHLPNGLATMNGRRLDDVGAGGKNILWGCTCECLAQSAFDVHEHVTGPITEAQVLRARQWFEALGIEPQPPVLAGVEFTWDEIQLIFSSKISALR